MEGSAATQSLFYCASCWQQNTITQSLFVLHLIAKTLMLQKFLKTAHKKTQACFIFFAANLFLYYLKTLYQPHVHAQPIKALAILKADPGSIAGQSVRDLCSTERHSDRLSADTSAAACQCHSTNAPCSSSC